MRWLAPLIAAAALVAAPVAAAPTVEIKAQSQLTLDRVRLIDDGVVEVRGRLADKLTGEGLGGHRVTVAIGDARGAGRTDPDGTFAVTLDGVEPGPQPIRMTYDGAPQIDPADPFATTTDPARAQVALALRTEPAPGGAGIVVTATVDDRPAELTVELSAGPPAGELVVLGQVRTGAPYVLTRAKAGGPGTQRVRATYPGDDTRQPASAELTIDMPAETRTTMEVASGSLAYEDDVVATGKVTDEDGRPVARAAVALTSNDRRLAQGATAADGTYRLEVEAEILGQGQHPIRVRTDPGQPSLRPSDSPPSILTIAAPQPVPISYTVAAFIATVLAAGGFFTARAKPWQRLRRPAPPAEAPANGAETEPTDGGLVVNRPSLVSTLRRPSDDGFSGAVRDTVRQRPIDGSVVRLFLDGAAPQEQWCAADGSFTFERLGPGEWRCEVSAPGHLGERFGVSIPHRGELRGVRVDLVPVRERIFQLYRRAAEPILPDPKLWGIWSPRQIVDHVRARRPTPALAELTDFVEEAYFSPRLLSEAMLPDAADRVERAIHERAHAAGS